LARFKLEDLYKKVGKGRIFSISFRGEKIKNICKSYDDVPDVEKLAIFGSTSHLEIAINKANASGLLGLRYKDPVCVNFSD